MELTVIGLIQLIIGIAVVITGRLSHAMLFLLLSGLLGGSASIVLPALGGSSIPPIFFALLPVYLRILVPRGGYVGMLPGALHANRWFGLFTFYGIACSYIAPRLFAGTIDVTPMRVSGAETLFDTIPLEPSSQNITAALYLFGTFLIAITSWIACRRDDGPKTLISATIGIAWAHVAIGLLAAASRGTFADHLLELLRNSTYDQFDDDIGGFARIRGIFVETSAYASFGFAFFVANVELWYRSIRPQATGAAAIALAGILFFSTSSTAYVALGAYLIFFLLRLLILPGLAVAGKIKTAIVATGSIGFIAAVIMTIFPSFADAVVDLVVQMTIEKPQSDSGVQRLFWAMQGWDAFVVSNGLGTGPGSFRSSSMIMAILGSMGVVGIVSFLMYLGSVFQPWRISSWGARAHRTASTVGGAYASAAVLSLIPAILASPHAFPSTSFAIFAGAALALRPLHSGKFADPEKQTQVALP